MYVLGGAAAWPRFAHAQPAGKPAVPVIGYLNSASPNESMHLVTAFRAGLSEAGYAEGHNLTIEYRWGHNQYDRMGELAADLVQRRVAVIFGTGPPAVLAAKAATPTIPVVFVVGLDPVRAGLVATLSRPGGNLTGVSLFTTALGAKHVELLHELLPKATVFAALVNSANPNASTISRDVTEAARALALRVRVSEASNADEIDAAFRALQQQRVDALLVGGDPLFYNRRGQFVSLAARHGLPTIYSLREFVTEGGLMSYGASITDVQRQAGLYTGRILAGAKVADLPVLQPTKFELVMNLKTAKALGLTVPSALLARADEVIE
jgi:putative tryptophan/tyrosine transport system substrate-binding protein